MSASTWTWLGMTTAWAQSTNWQLAGGDAGNGNGYPQSGDTLVLDSSGVQPLVVTGAEINDNIIDLSNGAVLDFADGSTLDAASNIYVTDPGATIAVAGVFTDLGNIDVVGTSAALSIALNGGTIAANNTVDYGLNVEQGNTLLINGGVIQDQEIHVHQGTAIVTGVTLANVSTTDLFSVTGGYLELQQATTVSADLSFVTTGSSGPSTIKLDNPALFGGDSNDSIQGFDTGDTLDLGTATIGTFEYSANSGYGVLTVEDTHDNTIFSAILSGNGLSDFSSGTFAVNGTGSTSDDGFVVTQGAGDTIITPGSITAATPTTWTWTGTTGAYNVSGNWSQSGGGGNASGYPITGDTALIPAGTMEIAGGTLDLASLSLGGTPGGGAIVTGGGELEVDSSLLMLGSSLLSADASSAIEIGGGNTLVAGAVVIDSGVTLAGSGIIVAAVVNDGELDSSNAPALSASSGGTLEITGGIDGTGSIVLGGGSTLKLDGAVGASQSIAFASGQPEDLVLGTPGTGFSNAITGLATGDDIELGGGMTLTSAALVNASTIAVDFTTGGTSGVYDLTNVSFANGSGTLFATGTDGTTGDSYIQVIQQAPQNPPENFTSSNISDVLFQDTANNAVALWTIQDGVATASTVLGTPSGGGAVMATGDLYGDGSSSVISEDSSGTVTQWQVQNGQITNSSVVGATSPSQWSLVGTGDLYGNGTDDLVFVDQATGGVAQWEMQDGSAIGATTVGMMGSGWSLAAIGNLSGSGNTDNLLFINTDGVVADWTVSNGVATQANVLGQTSSYWSIAGIGDFTGNGQNDILFRGQGGQIAMWEMQNGQVTGAESIGMASADWQIAGIGDYTGNGTDDILFQNTSSGALCAWEMQNGSVASVVNVGASSSPWQVVPHVTAS